MVALQWMVLAFENLFLSVAVQELVRDTTVVIATGTLKQLLFYPFVGMKYIRLLSSKSNIIQIYKSNNK